MTDTRIEVVQGDITKQEVDAIVNAANNHLWMGAGVAGAIVRRGGRGIENEAVRQGPINVSQAVVTGGGTLPAKHVIHAAVMGQNLQTDGDTIRQTTINALKLAEKQALRSVAFPALGTGVGGVLVGRVRAHHGAGGARTLRHASESAGRALRPLRRRGLCCFQAGRVPLADALAGSAPHVVASRRSARRPACLRGARVPPPFGDRYRWIEVARALPFAGAGQAVPAALPAGRSEQHGADPPPSVAPGRIARTPARTRLLVDRTGHLLIRNQA